MIGFALAGAIGMAVGGPAGAASVLIVSLILRRMRRRQPSPPPTRLVLLLLAVELRSGGSVLAALQETARALPDYQGLQVVARLAAVSGLTAALEEAQDEMRPIVAQLARAQRSGAPLVDTVRTLIERNLAEHRAARVAKARALPVKLMIPITLLVLPGLVLLLYGPSLLGLLEDLGGGLL